MTRPTTQAEPPDLTRLIDKVADGEDLSSAEAEGAFDLFMTGAATEIQMAGLLVGLRAKGVSPAEVAGAVRALRKAMVPVPAEDPDLLAVQDPAVAVLLRGGLDDVRRVARAAFGVGERERRVAGEHR